MSVAKVIQLCASVLRVVLEEDSILFSRFLLGCLLRLISMISESKLVVNLDANQS